jgi:hypothetical protein
MSIPEWKSPEKFACVLGRAAEPEFEPFLIRVQIPLPQVFFKTNPAARTSKDFFD